MLQRGQVNQSAAPSPAIAGQTAAQTRRCADQPTAGQPGIEHLGIAELRSLANRRRVASGDAGDISSGAKQWRAAFSSLTKITKRRTHQHRMKRDLKQHRILRPVALAAQREERLAFAAAHRPTPGPLHPQGQQPFGARIVIRKSPTSNPIPRWPQCEVTISLIVSRHKRRRCSSGDGSF